ncbi:MAG: HD domain-containing protein [Phycisphaeraceae bacterium]|nr:HD domain-containing protein [Phycisphaeraceae bacterium]
MLRVDIRRARTGMTLALPVRHPKSPTQTLLKVGFELDRRAIARLMELGVRTVWTQCPNLSNLESFVSREVAEAQGQLLQDLGSCLHNVQGIAAPRVDFETYTSSIGQMIRGLVENPKAGVFLGDLVDTDDAAFMRHCSTVAYLSLMMGLKLEGYLVQQRRLIPPARAKEVEQLGVGAMLHDIGMLQLDPEIKQRFYASGDRTDPEWREHPNIGYQMVHNKVLPTAATVVLHHHQRYDGSGFAGRDWPSLEGGRIHVFARIVAVADIFDRLRFPVAADPRPTVQALHIMTLPAVLATMDVRVVRALFTVAPPFPPGSMLRLSNGDWAVAVDHNPLNPCRPKVLLIQSPSRPDPVGDGQPLDLSQCGPGLRIVLADDMDVSAFQFDPPDFMVEDNLAANWS